MKECTYLGAIEVANQLGECILWQEQTHTLWWTDILSKKLFRFDPATQKLQTYEVPDRLASFGFTSDPSSLICAFANGLAYYRPESQAIEWIEQPELANKGQRFNDGRVDRQGRFWVGTMVENPELDETNEGAALYCLDGKNFTKKLTGLSISNSLCWSPEGDYLFFADSPTHTISRYPFEQVTARLGAAEAFAACPPFEPDGSTTDSEGMLWNALWGGSKVHRFSKNGEIDQTLDLEVSQPTCVCLGGPNLDVLFITTARVGLSDEELATQPLAGHVLMYQTPFSGLSECLFRRD